MVFKFGSELAGLKFPQPLNAGFAADSLDFVVEFSAGVVAAAVTGAAFDVDVANALLSICLATGLVN